MNDVTHTLTINLNPILGEEVSGILALIEGFVAAKRKESRYFAPLTLTVDVRELLARSRTTAIIWTTEDVHAQRPGLSDEQAWEVLRHAAEHIERDFGLKAEYLKRYALQLFGPPPATSDALRERLHCVIFGPDLGVAFPYQCFLRDGRCVLISRDLDKHVVIRSTFARHDDTPHLLPFERVPAGVYAILERVIDPDPDPTEKS